MGNLDQARTDKKLIEAAQCWARGVGGRTGLDDDDLAILSPEDRAALEASADFEVMEENWLAVQIFLSCSTQWRMHLMTVDGGFLSRLTGLDYTAVEAVMRIWRVRPADRADMLGRIRTMEGAALETMNG